MKQTYVTNIQAFPSIPTTTQFSTVQWVTVQYSTLNINKSDAGENVSGHETPRVLMTSDEWIVGWTWATHQQQQHQRFAPLHPSDTHDNAFSARQRTEPHGQIAPAASEADR